MILRKKQIIGQIYALLAGILFGSVGFLTIKVASSGISLSTALFWRFFIASIVLVPILLVRSEIKFNKKSVIVALFTGVLLNGPAILIYFMASNKIGIAFATTIFFCAPIFVALFAWITKSEILDRRTIIALILITIGMLFLYDNSYTMHIFGILLAVLAAIAYGLCIFANKRYSEEICIYNSTFMLCFGSAMYFLGVSLLNGKFMIPNTNYMWANIVTVSLVCTLLPVLFFFKSMQYISSVQLSILLLSEPIFSIFLGVIGFNEVINLKQSIAIAIILSGAIIHQTSNRSQEATI